MPHHAGLWAASLIRLTAHQDRSHPTLCIPSWPLLALCAILLLIIRSSRLLILLTTTTNTNVVQAKALDAPQKYDNNNTQAEPWRLRAPVSLGAHTVILSLSDTVLSTQDLDLSTDEGPLVPRPGLGHGFMHPVFHPSLALPMSASVGSINHRMICSPPCSAAPPTLCADSLACRIRLQLSSFPTSCKMLYS